MTKFRPCIDLHQGKVKQIVGSSLSDDGKLKTNFVSDRPASWFANMYKDDCLRGGHIIKLGEGNESAAKGALSAFRNGLQIGGGINFENAREYLEAGASHVIVTSWIIPDYTLDMDRLTAISSKVTPGRLVLDLSCRRQKDGWYIAKNKWRTLTEVKLSPALFSSLEKYCGEFLIHAADVEGKCNGIDEDLVKFLGKNIRIPVTYAGGARHIYDLDRVSKLSSGKIDLTIGSALDIFGGSLIKYEDCLKYNRRSQI